MAIDDNSIREHVRDLIAAYCQFLDDGLFDQFADLFHEDAVVHIHDDHHEGRQAIREWMEQVQGAPARGRHLVTNTRFTRVEAGGAECISDFVFFARDEKVKWKPTASGRYLDRWTPGEDSWRLAERTIAL